MNSISESSNLASVDYKSRTPEYYLSMITPDILHSLQPEQLAEFERVLYNAIPKPAPKIVDLRFLIDVVFSRFYVVLLIGKDRRTKQRRYVSDRITRIANAIVVALILIAMNLTISAFILLAGYLCKSAIGIDLFPNHFPDVIKHFFGLA